MPGYRDWIDAIDIKVDYFSAFMKAWIAFNAWYNFSGEVPTGNDKACIEYIASHTNRFKSYTINLINSGNSEGNTFRENVAKLHETLLNAAITTQEYIGVRQSISFAEVAVKNTNSHECFECRNIRYECTRAHGRITTVVSSVGTGIENFRYEQDEHNVDSLKQQSDFNRLTVNQQEKCLECYAKLAPYNVISVLSAGADAKQVGAYSFLNDAEKISYAIITILYMLRCCLAHGDISPDEAANNVYKYAYEVLIAPLKKLK